VSRCGEPPAAGTRYIPSFGTLNKIWPLRLHVAPTDRGLGSDAITRTAPDMTSTAFRRRPAKNAIVRLSGDQNGLVAPSVPSSGRATVDPSGRIQIEGDPLASMATNDKNSPFGDSASIPPDGENRRFSGSVIVNWTTARNRSSTESRCTANIATATTRAVVPTTAANLRVCFAESPLRYAAVLESELQQRRLCSLRERRGQRRRTCSRVAERLQ